MIGTQRLNLSLSDSDIVVKTLDIPSQVAAQLHFEKAPYNGKIVFGPFLNSQAIINPQEQYWQAFEANWDSGGACTAVLSNFTNNIPLSGLTQISPSPTKP